MKFSQFSQPLKLIEENTEQEKMEIFIHRMDFQQLMRRMH